MWHSPTPKTGAEDPHAMLSLDLMPFLEQSYLIFHIIPPQKSSDEK